MHIVNIERNSNLCYRSKLFIAGETSPLYRHLNHTHVIAAMTRWRLFKVYRTCLFYIVWVRHIFYNTKFILRD